MKAFEYLIPLVVIFGVLACSTAHVKMVPEDAEQIKKIAVIPMQSPPLNVDAFLSQSSLFGEALRTSSSLVLITDRTTQQIGAIGVLAFSIVMLASLPESMRHSDQMEKTANEILHNQNVWKPSVVIADLLATDLMERTDCSVWVAKQEQPYPDIDSLASLSNWDRSHAMGQWYAKQTTTIDDRSVLSQDIDCIIMVGINGFGLNYPGYLWMGIHLKVIEPVTGEVMGKAWVLEQGPHKKMESLLADDARKLKDEVVAVGRPVITKCLSSCGLVVKIEDRGPKPQVPDVENAR